MDNTFYTSGRWEDYPSVFVGPRIPPGLRWQRTLERDQEEETRRTCLGGDRYTVEIRTEFFLMRARLRGGIEYMHPAPDDVPEPTLSIWEQGDAWARRLIESERAKKEAKNV